MSADVRGRHRAARSPLHWTVIAAGAGSWMIVAGLVTLVWWWLS